MSNVFQRYAGALQLVFVVAVVGTALLISSSLKPDASFVPPSSAPSRLAVSVVAPEPVPFSPVVRLNGVVEARTATSVIPQVSGRVIEVSPAFRPGASVSKGDVLFRIEASDYALAVDRTLAEIEGARSELLRLEAEAAAERKIWENRFPNRPIPDLTARVPQIAAAKARIQSGEAARATAELSLGRTIVRAPFDAKILDTELDVGQVVNTGASVGTMFSIESLEVVVPVSAAELQRIGRPEGRVATIEPQIPTEPTITGSVVRKGASLDERTRLGSLYIQSEDIASLTLGEFVTVLVQGDPSAAAFRVPPGALTSRDQIWVVENGVLAARRVEVLAHEDDALVIADADFGEGIVAVPPPEARSGLPVAAAVADTFASSGGMSGASK